jgi:hypothetical protein
LRAALAELVSVEDVLPLDLTGGPHARQRFRMNDSPLPHLHLVRELRNYQLHLKHSPLSKFTSDLMWGHPDRLSEATPISVSRWLLDDVTVESFSRLKNAKHYRPAELAAMINWFNTTQNDWGVHEIILRSAIDYAEGVCRQFL